MKTVLGNKRRNSISLVDTKLTELRRLFLNVCRAHNVYCKTLDYDEFS